jgi:hypothetical protein
MLIDLWLGAVAVLILLGVLLRHVSTALVPEGRSQEVPVISTVGGGWWFGWPMRATWPFVRLEDFSWGVRISASTKFMRWSLPVTELRWADIEWAKIVTGRRVRFRRRSSGWGSVLFFVSWGSLPPQLLPTLRASGVRVIE